MTITPKGIARLRAIAEADMNGADGKAWDKALSAIFSHIQPQGTLL